MKTRGFVLGVAILLNFVQFSFPFLLVWLSGIRAKEKQQQQLLHANFFWNGNAFLNEKAGDKVSDG